MTAATTVQPTSHRHHFVPKRHVRRWAFENESDPDRALVYWRLKRGGPVKPLAVRLVFAETDHHLIRMLDGTDSSWIDQQLLSLLEGAIPSVIQSLADGIETLSTIGVDRKNLALYVNLLHQTVPAHVERRAGSIGFDRTEAAAFAAWRSAHTGAPSIEQARRQFAMGRALQVVLASGQSEEIARRSWQLLRVPASVASTLILGDVPVVAVVIPSADAVGYPILALPLDPRLLLVLHAFVGMDQRDDVVSDADVAAVNRVTWAQATRAAVAQDAPQLDLARLAGQPLLPWVIRQVAVREHPEAFGR